MATALHELTTYAAKYGALSNRSGRVAVRWRWRQNGSHNRLLIEWQETGADLVAAPFQAAQRHDCVLNEICYFFGRRQPARSSIHCVAEASGIPQQSGQFLQPLVQARSSACSILK